MVQLTLLTTCLSQHVLYMSQHLVSKVSWTMQVSNETCNQQGLLDQTGLVIGHVTSAARSIRPMRHTVEQSMYGKISSSLSSIFCLYYISSLASCFLSLAGFSCLNIIPWSFVCIIHLHCFRFNVGHP